MEIGDRVKIIDNSAFQDPKVIGKTGTIKEYHYSIERWWEKGKPLDHSVGVELEDGTVERCFTSDLRRFKKGVEK